MTTLAEIITILKNRLESLATARISAIAGGDLAQVAILDKDILETQATLDQISP